MKIKAYWISRFYTQIAALLILVVIILSSMSPPQVEAPSPISAPLIYIPFVFSAIIFLLPYKLSENNFYYYLRLAVYFLVSIGLLCVGIKNIIIFGLSTLDGIGSLCLILLAFSAPTSLIIYKQMNKYDIRV